MADSSNQEVDVSSFPDGNSENSESVVRLASTNSPQYWTEDGINVLQQIANEKGKIVKYRSGRFHVVYDDNTNEYKTRIKRVKIKADGYSSEYIANINKCLEGITFQCDELYPFTVIRNNNEHESITPSKSNMYREGSEYIEIPLDEETPLYEHLEENPAVRLVRDLVTGFIHICKTRIMSEFRCAEVKAMLSLPKVAPELYVVNRDEEDVNLHMELIEGHRLDIVANYIKNEHMWPLCLQIFSEILYAITILMSNGLSHHDIHTKNIIIEVVEEGKFRIRLIDYGDAREYTINNLINDMRSLVATLLTLFTRSDFKADKEEPDEWIENNPEVWERYPKHWFIFKGALDVTNNESLRQFINFVEVSLAKNSKNPDFNKRLEEIAKSLE
jgi:tRNA A-37 threonylcarbamoyl transferase component Bud32